jgi:signal transduction histidine kinase
MMDVMQSMAAGEYGRCVTVESADEVGRLARAFNTMSANLADLERQRDDLITNVSHELRTPIAVLHASIENLLDDVVENERATLEAMLGQAERLGRLVAELLELSRLEGGIVALRAERVDLVDLVRSAIDAARLRVPAPEIELAAPRSLVIDGDRQRLESVLANVIDNAIAHGGSGRIAIEVSATSDMASVSVTDQGTGVPPEDLARIFDRFYRSGGSSGGLGLGLAIASWVADLHGGAIEASNVEPTGLRVTLSLPRSADPARVS